MRRIIAAAGGVLGLAVLMAAGPVYDDPAKAAGDPAFAIQGEYVGELRPGTEVHKIGAQIIALGQGRFHIVGYGGGLPGAGWDGEETRRAEAMLENGRIVFQKDEHSAVWENGVVSVFHQGTRLGELQRVERSSPTLGMKPPAGAVVLFDGSAESLKQWIGPRVTADGLLMEGVTSSGTFGDHRLHVEFRLPFMPEARGQARGNSGVYLHGRYEVQMLDSFGLMGEDNECGGVYRVAKPRVNMCLPPLTWQTYDIDFKAPRFDAAGKKIAPAKMTVRHNGVVIHENLELPGPTVAAPGKGEVPAGPVYLQNHGNPVRYRNVWVLRAME